MLSAWALALVALTSPQSVTGSTGTGTQEPEGWQHDSIDRVTRYIVRGQDKYGHTLGLAKLAGHCAQDVLWLTWTSVQDMHKGDTVPVRFSTGSEAVALDLSVTNTYEVPGAGTVLLFTNRALTDDLLWLLTARQGNVLVTAEGIQDSFPVTGFSAARARAGALCFGA